MSNKLIINFLQMKTDKIGQKNESKSRKNLFPQLILKKPCKKYTIKARLRHAFKKSSYFFRKTVILPSTAFFQKYPRFSDLKTLPAPCLSGTRDLKVQSRLSRPKRLSRADCGKAGTGKAQHPHNDKSCCTSSCTKYGRQASRFPPRLACEMM